MKHPHLKNPDSGLLTATTDLFFVIAFPIGIYLIFKMITRPSAKDELERKQLEAGKAALRPEYVAQIRKRLDQNDIQFIDCVVGKCLQGNSSQMS